MTFDDEVDEYFVKILDLMSLSFMFCSFWIKFMHLLWLEITPHGIQVKDCANVSFPYIPIIQLSFTAQLLCSSYFMYVIVNLSHFTVASLRFTD